MKYEIHGARKGQIKIEHSNTAKQAAKRAVAQAKSGYEVTVMRGSAVAMICSPGKRSTKGGPTARCKIRSQPFMGYGAAFKWHLKRKRR